MVEQPVIRPEEEASEEEFKAALAAAEAAASATAAPATLGATHYVSVDSLQANEFHIELDGAVVTGVFRVSGLMSFNRAGGQSPVTLSKMVQRDATLPFNQWIRATLASPDEHIIRTLDIVAVDDGEETRRWKLSGAYIVAIRYEAFDTSSTDLIEEIVTLGYDNIYEYWTWSDKQ